MKHEVEIKHVYGHQDGAGRAKAEAAQKKQEEEYEKQLKAYEEHPYPHSDSSVSTITGTVNKIFNPRPKEPVPPAHIQNEEDVLMNLESDRLASGTTAAVLAGGTAPSVPLITLPYKGSKALLRIGKKWITSKTKAEIYRGQRKKKMIQYCKERYNWSNQVVEMVNWDTVGTVRRGTKSRRSRRFTSKLMHGWLPIMHMRQVVTGIKQCPGCSHKDETMTHLFRCPHKLIEKARQESMKKIRKWGETQHIPQHIMEAICHVITTEVSGGSEWIQSTYTPEVVRAIKQQLKIGTNLLLRGFVAKGWQEAIQLTGSSNPERKAVALQRMMWELWAEPIWKARLSVLHGPDSFYFVHMDKQLSEKILWFAKHKHEVLARCDQFMARIDTSRLHKMKRQTKQAWCKQLDKVRKAFEIESRTRGRGQSVITSFMVRRDGIT